MLPVVPALPSAVQADFRSRREAVRLPSRHAVGGVASLPEILSSYGIYIFFSAIALAGGAVILNNVLGTSTVNEFGIVVSAVQELYRNQQGADKTGLTTQTIANSGRLPDKLVENQGATNAEIWVGGGDYQVEIYAGVAGANLTALGFGNPRYFVVTIGDQANSVPADLCSDLIFAPYVGRVGVVVLDTPATTPTTAELWIGAAVAGRHWSVRNNSATILSLEEMLPEDVELACTNAEASTNDGHIAMVFR